MTTGESSCRPARLERFGETVDALCDGLVVRAGLLEDALSEYQGSCDASFRAPTIDTAELVRAVAAGLRDVGDWTGGVGAAFRAVMEEAGWPEWAGFDRKVTIDDARVVGHLDEWPDPYRGVPEGMAAQLAADLGMDYDPDGPPAWVDLLADGATGADVIGPLLEGTAMALADLPAGVTVTLQVEAGFVAVLSDGRVVARLTRAQLTARLMLPAGTAPRLATATSWVSRGGAALAFMAGAGDQWYGDAGLPSHERVARAVTRGAGLAGSSAAGGALGVQAGVVCGPATPLCSTVFGIGGAIGGGMVGDAFIDALPFMDTPPPGEHDTDDIIDAIGADGGTVDARLAASADLQASDLAVLATADDPVLNQRVISILPDDDVLERIIAFDDASAPPWVATGTTTTSTTAPPPPPPLPAPGGGSTPPDPWVGDRPGEP
jgi:hypothetical protein